MTGIFVLAVVLISFISICIGMMIGGYNIKKNFLSTKEDKNRLQDYMRCYWLTEPSNPNIGYVALLAIVSVAMLIVSFNHIKDETLEKYDKGEIVRVVTYTTTEKPGQAPIRDSTFRYEPRRND